MATKTQVVDSVQVVSGTLSVVNQHDYPILISAPTKILYASAGSWHAVIKDISTSGWNGPDPQPDPPPDTELVFAVYLKSGTVPDEGEGTPFEYIVGHDFVYFDWTVPTPWNITGSFSIATGTQRIWRTEVLRARAGRENAPVFAGDVSYEDEWRPEDTFSWDVSFMEWSSSGSGPSDEVPPYGSTYAAPLNTLTIAFQQHKGAHYEEGQWQWQKYIEVSSVRWNGETVNLSRYEKMSDPPNKPPDGEHGYYVDGKLGGYELWAQYQGDWSCSPTIYRPLQVDFGAFGVWNREGELMGQLRIDGGFTATNHYPDTLTWSTEP